MCAAHVGSPDVFLEGSAGPYRLLVTVRPPQVVPGVAEVEVRSAAPGVREIRVAPSPLTGPAAQLTPSPDPLTQSAVDPQFFTGSLWLMACCNWRVHVYVDGVQGKAELAVPVVSVASRTLAMQKTMAAALLFFLIFLGAGAVSIAGAYVREGRLEPGTFPAPADRRRAGWAMAAAAVFLVAVGTAGKRWWDSEDQAFRQFIYKPLEMSPSFDAGAGTLTLELKTSGWLQKTGDLLPDHGHLMHLYVIRTPEMERVWHLHPEMTDPGRFVHRLPPMPAGEYRLFADIVHESGLPETLTAQVRLPAVDGMPLTGDDSAGSGMPVGLAGESPAAAGPGDGYRMVWDRPADGLRASKPESFRFRLEDKDGRPASRMELYMGMQGHAAFVRTDFSVFAHVHPSGTVPMASLSLVNPHAGHVMAGMPPAEATFPYAFPKPGLYRIFVQMKRSGRILTGIFDARVD